jgi:predicted ArsR family transcriptional regulator
LIYDELSQEVGQEKATEVLRRAIYRRGVALGAQYTQHAPHDLDGLRQAFLDNIPDEGRMFAAQVQRCDADQLDMTLTSCPLKEAWQEAGLDDEQVATMCRIAAEIDLGMFEGAGFKFSAETWQAGADGCCHLHIRPGTNAGTQ